MSFVGENRQILAGTDGIKPVERLANAIILQAVDDYRRLLTSKPTRGFIGSETEIEQFFTGDFFKVLTKLDGPFLMKRVRTTTEAFVKESRRHFKRGCENDTFVCPICGGVVSVKYRAASKRWVSKCDGCLFDFEEYGY